MDAVADCGAEKRAICCDCDRCDALVFFRHELVTALVLTQVPNTHIAATVAGDEFSLIWVNHDIVDWDAV